MIKIVLLLAYRNRNDIILLNLFICNASKLALEQFATLYLQKLINLKAIQITIYLP